MHILNNVEISIVERPNVRDLGLEDVNGLVTWAEQERFSVFTICQQKVYRKRRRGSSGSCACAAKECDHTECMQLSSWVGM